MVYLFKYVSILLFIVLFRGTVCSHPHVFVETELTFCFDENGVEKIKVKFHYNKMFLKELMYNFDDNENNKFEKNEIENIRKNAFSNLVNYNYFIHITNGKTKIKHGIVSDFNVIVAEEGLYYSFTLETKIPFNKSYNKYKIAAYEHSYYIDVRYKAKGIKFKNTDAYTCEYKIIEDQSQAYYYNQIYPETIVLSMNKKQ